MRPRVLIACVLAPAALWAILPLPSSGQNLQQKIDRARGEVQRKKGTERVLSTDIAEYTRKINGLQARETRVQADLDAKTAELVRLQDSLRDERARLTRLRVRLVETRRKLGERLVEIYKADKPDVLSVILNSDGFADLLERGEFIQRIAESDRKIVLAVRTAKADSQETEARLDRLERRQQRVTAIVLAHRNEIQSVKMQLIGVRVGKANALSHVRSERHAIEEDLEAMEAQQEKIQARLAGVPAGGPIRHGSGQMIWPVNGPITGSFGEARPGHIHAGIDIAAPTGTPIRAALGGRVALAGWMGGYGQYTCIQHSGSLSTCYGHQSRIGVSVGQNVSQGQVIGAVGSTGHSTGPHLHFETRVGGSPVSPLGYL